MPKAQCYYEILGINELATADDVKRAYRNLALVWHPDKNQANADEAHVKFQAILKAYETLSDPKERDWYDRHKDLILSDGDSHTTQDSSVNLFQYFSSSCYANFDDHEDGFYTVYRNVFQNISEEEKPFVGRFTSKTSKDKKKDRPEDAEFPPFGSSDSPYDQVVRPFYSFWSGFCTKMTFDHLDKYKTTDAENRKVLRLMEKENNKVKDQARKERNAKIRKLVEFIKKRDKRLKAQAFLTEQQNRMNREKTAEKQRLQREKLHRESSNYKPTAWDDMNDIEHQLQQLEDEYDNVPKRKGRVRKTLAETEPLGEHFDDDIIGDDNRFLDDDQPCDQSYETPIDEDHNDIDEFLCQACNKGFKTPGAFENHEASKKHKQNVLKLAKILKQEESLIRQK